METMMISGSKGYVERECERYCKEGWRMLGSSDMTFDRYGKTVFSQEIARGENTEGEVATDQSIGGGLYG